MKGDFSTRLDRDDDDNDVGVAWQQGRVFLDADGNAQTRLAATWQAIAAADTIGAGVLAVPAAEPGGFRVTSATVGTTGVSLEVGGGHAWADGVLVRERGGTRLATYLQPPVQSPAAAHGTIAAGVRDAVVLEAWYETVSAFQEPERLLEPALGGVDTTGRVRIGLAYRLLRLSGDQHCDDVRGLLGGDAGKGRLTATLVPVLTVGDPCPVEVGGGYTGFEHQLYRVEIAEVTAAATHFKWSRYNGGLVGRGVFDAGTGRVAIRANLQAIATSGLSSFYLEAVERAGPDAPWRVTYGATVTLSGDQLVLPATPSFGAVPAAGPAANPNVVFFRLWDALRPISDFSAAAGTELADGIRLAFEAGGTGRYVPEDHWTFSVRAGGVANEETLVDDELPHGVRRIRVPLAVLEWTGGAPSTITAAAGRISDCRLPFQPLTRLGGCCTYRVGDGIRSHGDFTTIQAAVNALPVTGGRVCVLPGVFREAVRIENRANVVVSGCGGRSRVTNEPAPGGAAPAGPVFTIRDCQGVRLERMAVDSIDGQPGVLVEEAAANQGVPREVSLAGLRMAAGTSSAVEVQGATGFSMRKCDVLMRDVSSPWPAVFVRADDVVIERNRVRVAPRAATNLSAPASAAVEFPPEDVRYPVGAGRGGIQLAGTCDRVRVSENVIRGGIGNGITLGSFAVTEGSRRFHFPWIIDTTDPCSPCRPGSVIIIGILFPDGTPSTRSAGALTDVRIRRNRILDMGLAGVGVAGFFDLSGVDEMIQVDGLTIEANRIRRCLNRTLAPIPVPRTDTAGYGAICLADVTRLRIRSNDIDDNGRDALEPVCGIFVLHGEGVEIAHNRITGPATPATDPRATPGNGRRGGINLVYCTAPTAPVRTVFAPELPVPVQTGEPALLVHDNVVAVPLGQALMTTALGPVTVQGNQLTTGGVWAGSLLASTVLLMNLGISNEFYGQLITYALMARPAGEVPRNGTQANATYQDGQVVLSKEGLDDVGARLFANGNVLFSDNQVVLSLLAAGASGAFTSVAIFTLDDLGFSDNQCDCDLFDDFVLVHAALIGMSVRVTDNRFKEGVLNAFFSALTMGLLMNVTAHNQSTHCLLITGPSAGLLAAFGQTTAGKRVAGPNTVLLGSLCGRLSKDMDFQQPDDAAPTTHVAPSPPP